MIVIFGEAFSGEGVMLGLFCAFIPLRFVATTKSAAISSSDRNSLRIVVSLASVVLTLVIGHALVNRMGVAGAVCTTLSIEAFGLLAYTALSKYLLRTRRIYATDILPYVLAGIPVLVWEGVGTVDHLWRWGAALCCFCIIVTFWSARSRMRASS
jgi:O-antigen/teichoic acid export membrane protein